MTKTTKTNRTAGALGAAALSLMAAPALAQDLTVDGSLCVGIDCATSESFGFDTIRMKENNLRIKFQDTSSSASFPSTDWEITANDSSNGGRSYLGITDVDGGRMPFRVEAGAPANALVVEQDGDIGIKTLEPAVDLHVVEGNTPTLRLEQDGSDGFTSQVWDLAGNETNFFVRDVTNGSRLPFRIEPGAPGDSIYIDSSGNVGMGRANPTAAMHVMGESMRIESSTGRANFTLSDTTDPGPDFRTQLTAGSVRFSYIGTGAPEMELFQSGDLAISGNYISAGTTLTVPDYVFADDYALRPLAEVRAFIDTHSHLPDVPSAADIAAEGLDLSEMQMTLLKKIEELTLYTLEQEAETAALKDQVRVLKAQQAQTEALEARLTAKIERLRPAQD